MNAIQASTSKSSASPSKQPSFVPSCVSPSSVFYQVLTAPYRPPTHLVICQRRPVDPRHVEACHNCLDRTKRPRSETHVVPQPTELNATASAIQEHQMYTPHGRWAWADGLSIDDKEELIQLECK
jgi:hypothetical protein